MPDIKKDVGAFISHMDQAMPMLRLQLAEYQHAHNDLQQSVTQVLGRLKESGVSLHDTLAVINGIQACDSIMAQLVQTSAATSEKCTRILAILDAAQRNDSIARDARDTVEMMTEQFAQTQTELQDIQTLMKAMKPLCDSFLALLPKPAPETPACGVKSPLLKQKFGL